MAKSTSASYTTAQLAVIDSIAVLQRDEEEKKFWNSTPEQRARYCAAWDAAWAAEHKQRFVDIRE